MKAVWLVLVWILGLVGGAVAHAEEPSEPSEPSGVQRTLDAVDEAFGTYVVGALDAVLFFDLAFWDNALPRDASIVGQTVPGALAGLEASTVRIDEADADGFSVRAVHVLEDPVLEPIDVEFGSVRATLASIVQGPPGSEGPPRIMARVAEQPVDLDALGVEPWPESPGPSDVAITMVTGVAPFPLRVDRQTAEVQEATVPLRPDQVPWVEGMVVRTPEGRRAVVSAVRGDGVEALGEATAVARIRNPANVEIPLVVAWLVFGAIFFTLRMAFVNIRMFGHALLVTGGVYDDPEDEGEISHFQALSSALSATVGLGNIAGVAIAVSAGGPGAILWMVLAGFLGMSSKFTECTLGQMYRRTRPDGSVSGGPMHYLDEGLAELGWPTFGRVLAVLFALLCIGGSFGGGNMFQANQSFQAVAFVAADYGLVGESTTALGIGYGMVLTFLVGLVIIGGIQRIGAAAGLIVPFMVAVYVLAGIFILVVHIADVPSAFMTILREDFTPQAAIVGGFVGVLVQGFRRAAFSNEAGVGSASIAHSAATTAYPVREGIVALLEPFIDTMMVCTMTGLVVVITGAYQTETADGVVMTQQAFGSVMSWFPLVLSIAVILFAFSTMISWSYYGERCSVWLFGDNAKMPYRVVFLFFVFLGANLQLGNVLAFSDLMILGMAFPNILGALFLTGKVKAALDDYIARLRSGEFDPA